MNTRQQEGVTLLFLAGLIGLLWLRGYLSPLIGSAIAAIGAPPAKQPFQFTPNAAGLPVGAAKQRGR